MNADNQQKTLEKSFFFAIKLNPNQEKELQSKINYFMQKHNKNNIKLFPFFPTFIEISSSKAFSGTTQLREEITAIQSTKIDQDHNYIFLNWIITFNDEKKSSCKMIICKKKSPGVAIELFTPEDFTQKVKIFRILRVEKEGFQYSFFDEKWSKLK